MSCVYLNEEEKEACCNASISRMKPGFELKTKTCLTDDYDFCAFLLAHILRHGSRKPDIRRSIAI